MNQNKKKTLVIVIIIVCVVLIVAGFLIWYTKNFPERDKELSIVTVWDMPYDNENHRMDTDGADLSVRLQRQGFEKGFYDNLNGLSVYEFLMSEGSDFRTFTADIANLCNSTDIILSVGASTDEATMNTAMEMNYFKIPMLIPFGDGDLSGSSGSTFSLRMTPTADNYADFIGNLFPAYLVNYINGYVFENLPVPDYSIKLGVFFADNFNGHEIAVKLTQKLMDNGMDIQVYQPFSEDDLLRTVRTAWDSESAMMEGLDAVIILAEDHDDLPNLPDVLDTWDQRGLKPQFIVTGYYPETVDEKLVNMDNFFVVQQVINIQNCPAEINTRSEAMGYAAGYIASKALYAAYQNTRMKASGFEWLMSAGNQRMRIREDYISNLRNNIHSEIRGMAESIPCYGYINFESAENNRVSLEIVRLTGNESYSPVDPSVIFYRMVNIIRSQFDL